MPQRKSEVDWTPEAIRRFWNWHGAAPASEAVYFTAMVGRGVVRFLEASGRLKGDVLDFGCGPGHLLSHLLERGAICHAADVSAESVAAVAARFAGHANFRRAAVAEGGRIPYPERNFDVVLCVETLEHVPPAGLSPLLGEIQRVLRPGGTALFTTPFAEDLERGLTYCPFCDSEFHRWQHFRAYDADGLSSLLSRAGFRVLFCRNMDFSVFQRVSSLRPLSDLSFAKLRSSLASGRRRLLDRLFPVPFPGGRELSHLLMAGHGRHLCALAEAPEARDAPSGPCAG